MTIDELRELLMCLPERFDATEVTTYSSRGLVHVDLVELDRRRTKRENEFWDDIPASRLERKLRISGRQRQVLWHQAAPEWRLDGWWPAEAAEIGLGIRGAVR